MANHILALTKYSRMGASSRLRTLQYIPFLEQQGINITVQSLFDDQYLENLYSGKKNSKLSIINYYIKRLHTLLRVKSFDVVWVEKELFPYLPAFFEQLLSFFGVKYVVDYDDAIFHNYDLSKNFIVRTFLSKKIDSVMKSSSCITVGNSYLMERAKQNNSSVQWVPTVIDIDRYVPRRKEATDSIIIGWIGSPSTQKYILELKDALIAISKKHPISLLLVGANKNITNYFPGINVEVVPWNETTEVMHIQKMDIGIMPLTDGPWEKGKCGYKLIQYMACSIPVIASPVGVNVDIVNNSNSGYLAGSTNEWIKSIDALASSSEQRYILGASGRRSVETTYSVQVQATKLFNLFKGIAKRNYN